MKSMILRVGLSLVALWGASHAGSLWRPAAGLCENATWAQLRPATIAPQATQATQLSASRLGTTAGQPLGGMPGQMFSGASRPGGQGTGAARPADDGSLLQGNERFLRRNRRGRAFVGTDAEKAKEFVGAASAATGEQVPPAVGDVRLSGANAGTTVVSKPPRVNDPRLTVGFDVPRAPTVKISAALTRQLKAIPGLNPANQIEVSVAGETATLRGVVVSARDRTLAAQLVLFEPGISAVRNDLLVSPLRQDPEQLPPTAVPLTRQPASRLPAGK